MQNFWCILYEIGRVIKTYEVLTVDMYIDMKFGTKLKLTIQIKKEKKKIWKVNIYFTEKNITNKMSKLKFANFYKLYYLLTYKPEIGTEASVGESDSHLQTF